MTGEPQNAVEPGEGAKELDSEQVMEKTRQPLIRREEQLETLLETSKAECLRLATMMHQRLPTELRQMVYQYIYVEERPILIGKYHSTRYKPLYGTQDTPDNISEAPSRPKTPRPQLVHALSAGPDAILQDHTRSPPDDMMLPSSHALDPEFMGLAVAYEASQLYYASNTFSVCALEDWVQKFLLEDARTHSPGWTSEKTPLGLLPIDYVHNLQVRVKHEHLDWPMSKDNLDKYLDLMKQIVNGLKALTRSGTVTTRPQRSIEVIVMTDFHVEDVFDFSEQPLDETVPVELFREDRNCLLLLHLMEAIRFPFYELKYDQDTQISVSHNDGYKPFPRDLTHLFALDKSDWEYEKEEVGKSMTGYSPLDFMLTALTPSEGRELHYLLRTRWGCYQHFSLSQSRHFPELKRIPRSRFTKSAYWPTRDERRRRREDYHSEPWI